MEARVTKRRPRLRKFLVSTLLLLMLASVWWLNRSQARDISHVRNRVAQVDPLLQGTWARANWTSNTELTCSVYGNFWGQQPSKFDVFQVDVLTGRQTPHFPLLTHIKSLPKAYQSPQPYILPARNGSFYLFATFPGDEHGHWELLDRNGHFVKALPDVGIDRWMPDSSGLVGVIDDDPKDKAKHAIRLISTGVDRPDRLIRYSKVNGHSPMWYTVICVTRSNKFIVADQVPGFSNTNRSPYRCLEIDASTNPPLVNDFVLNAPADGDVCAFGLSSDGNRIAWLIDCTPAPAGALEWLEKIQRLLGHEPLKRHTELWITNRDGSQSRLMAIGPIVDAQQLSGWFSVLEWSPDDKRLVVGMDKDLWVVPVD